MASAKRLIACKLDCVSATKLLRPWDEGFTESPWNIRTYSDRSGTTGGSSLSIETIDNVVRRPFFDISLSLVSVILAIAAPLNSSFRCTCRIFVNAFSVIYHNVVARTPILEPWSFAGNTLESEDAEIAVMSLFRSSFVENRQAHIWASFGGHFSHKKRRGNESTVCGVPTVTVWSNRTIRIKQRHQEYEFNLRRAEEDSLVFWK